MSKSYSQQLIAFFLLCEMRTLIFVAISILLLSLQSSPPVRKIHIEGFAQGTTYHITYYAPDSSVVKSQIDSILDKIDSSLSLYKPWSLVNAFNNSSDGIIPDEHFAKVVNKAMDVWKETNGLFDITIFPITDAWGFGPRKPNAIPDSVEIARRLSCVDTRLIHWNGQKLEKTKPCVQLDPNGIAQGYSVDVIADFLDDNNIHDYLVEVGGELRVKGRKQPGRERMSIGIEAPDDTPGAAILERTIWPRDGAITTSGNYRRYHESNGQKISHLLNPKTGYPLKNELISITIYANDAVTADAYDNAIMGMGLSKGLEFVNNHPALSAYFIYRKQNGDISDTMSTRFYEFLKP